MNTNLNIENVYNSIVSLAKEGKDISDVDDYIIKEIGYTKKYINVSFVNMYRITINDLFKKKRLQRAYDVWMQMGRPSLSEKATFDSIGCFRRRFKETFGGYPEEIYEDSVNLDSFMPDSELYKSLERLEMVSDYRIVGNCVRINFDPKKLLLYSMGLPMYIVPQELWEKYCTSMSLNEKKYIILTLTKAAETSSLQVQFDIETLSCLTEELNSYNIDAPYRSGDYMVFSPNIDDTLFSIFEDMVTKIMPGLCVPGYFPTEDVFMWKYVRWKAQLKYKKEENIEGFANYSGMDVKDVVASLWKNIRLGYIRYELSDC